MYPNPLDKEANDSQSVWWELGGRVHNWQNYIGDRVKALWRNLSDDIKLAIAQDAEERASNEDWD